LFNFFYLHLPRKSAQFRTIIADFLRMKITLNLHTWKKETAEGFPLVFDISHQGKRREYQVGFCKDIHFIGENNMISSKHPDYDDLAPVLFEYKLKANKVVVQQEKDIDAAYNKIFKVKIGDANFIEFAEGLVVEMNTIAGKFDKKKDLVSRNRIAGNAKVYENFINQVKPFVKDLLLNEIEYDLLIRFKNYQMGIGNSKNTVHQYLRTFRAIYNKGLLKYGLPDKKPFTGVFDGLKVKSYQNKKKYITKDDIAIIESVVWSVKEQRYIDLWLLQFYFGGCDLIDLYYMPKNMIRKGRVYFERGKHSSGLMIDLKIHPKAKVLLDKFANESQWLIDSRKDVKGYETFRGNYRSTLIEMQKKYKIDIMPTGGNIGSKVARHSFAVIAKNLNLEPDLIRELMGHERDDVDQYYKDRFPEAVRDEALFRIIGD